MGNSASALGVRAGLVCIGTEVGPYEGPEHSRDRVGFRFSQDLSGCRGMIVGPQAGAVNPGRLPLLWPGTRRVAIGDGSMSIVKIKLAFWAVLSCW